MGVHPGGEGSGRGSGSPHSHAHQPRPWARDQWVQGSHRTGGHLGTRYCEDIYEGISIGTYQGEGEEGGRRMLPPYS